MWAGRCLLNGAFKKTNMVTMALIVAILKSARALTKSSHGHEWLHSGGMAGAQAVAVFLEDVVQDSLQSVPAPGGSPPVAVHQVGGHTGEDM